jgi:NAD(P)H-dependent nitrite reductase small subunit
MNTNWTKVAESSDVRERFGFSTNLLGTPIALFRFNSHVYALRDACPHQGAPISEGYIQNGILTCPHHNWTFDLETGKFISNNLIRIPAYPVKEENGYVYVQSLK